MSFKCLESACYVGGCRDAKMEEKNYKTNTQIATKYKIYREAT